ncbi:MAG: hypothetical protein JMDDDDMK_04797 [Acidobacteria bacterium]|nr:hypothetical protein [Acidobacteriota bacterium]
MPKFTKFIYAAIGLWLISTLLIHLAGYNEAAQILRGFWPLLSILFAALLALLCVIAFFVDRPKLWAAWAIFLVALAIVGAFKTFGSWGAWIHFQAHRNRYETIVRQVLAASTDEERKSACVGDCWLYSNEPVRVAFHYAHGFLNWHDIVFDPTGKVAHPNRPYDGYLVATDHLTDDWFFCHFAD